MSFLDDLDAFTAERLPASDASGTADVSRLLQVALANEINVSELAASWMPSTPELPVKLAFARQAGDEAGHFMLVADRLRAQGFDPDGFKAESNPMFDYLRTLTATPDRIAAGLYALESIAYAVNESFMAFCAARGDDETVRIYREYIQPDERAHRRLGRELLAKYGEPARVREIVGKTLELAGTIRTKAAAKLGVACFPGC